MAAIHLPALSNKQLGSKMLFQHLNMLADAGLGHMKLACGGRKIEGFCCSQKNIKLVSI